MEHKVDSAIKTPPTKPRGWLLEEGQRNGPQPARLPKRIVKVPPVDTLANIKKFIGEFRCTEEDLIKVSPVDLSGATEEKDFHKQASLMVEHLFEEDDLVNIVRESKKSETGKWNPIGCGGSYPRNSLAERLLEPLPKRLGGCWFRFNPMDGKGVTDRNVTDFRKTLIEFDGIPLDLQLSLLAKIPLPIASVSFSGNGSYHALVVVDAFSLEDYTEAVGDLYSLMSRFGIDPKNKNASRLSRLAGVYRGDQQQRLCYLNPEPSAKGIL